MRIALALALCLGLVGCSDDPRPETLPTGEWLSLLSAPWSLAPGEEKYICARRTLDGDAYLARFAPDHQGAGTHHTLLTIADEAGPDGVSDCSGFDNGSAALYATGYGTGEWALPDGVAVRVPAGAQLLLNIHLLNTSSQIIEGVSGTAVYALAPDAVQARAEVVLAGKTVGLEVIPGASEQLGTCTFEGAAQIHGVMPHMHARGSHFRLTAQRAAGDLPILDEPFDVEDQSYRLAEVPMEAGDRLEVVCGYENPDPVTYGFGPSADDEMCYAIFFRYPALGGSNLCTH